MLSDLRLQNVGPSPEMHLHFGDRLNLITGDNGLGKSFLLDVAWWALTRRWPGEVNPKLTTGRKALPIPGAEGLIEFSFSGKTKIDRYESRYDRRQQAWIGRPGRPANPGLVLYAMTDGSFAVWDPHRNYWRQQDAADGKERIPAYVFSPTEVWDGQQYAEGSWLCNGLIRDWGNWQRERGAAFSQLQGILSTLSPSQSEPLTPGELTRISLDDVRDIPTLIMPYGQEVPVVHLSSGMRRIIALAYLLVWAWNEHQKAAKQLGEDCSDQVVFFVDEIEAHLHPSWQRLIVPSLLSVMKSLNAQASVQLITTTHSPLVMTSVEPHFTAESDAWFDLDFRDRQTILTRRDFEPLGDAALWYTSDAFDLETRRPVKCEELVIEASRIINEDPINQEELKRIHQELIINLRPVDSFLETWRAICHKRGLLKVLYPGIADTSSIQRDALLNLLLTAPDAEASISGSVEFRINRAKAHLGWDDTTGSARKWWNSFEQSYGDEVVAATLEWLSGKGWTIPKLYSRFSSSEDLNAAGSMIQLLSQDDSGSADTPQ